MGYRHQAPEYYKWEIADLTIHCPGDLPFPALMNITCIMTITLSRSRYLGLVERKGSAEGIENFRLPAFQIDAGAGSVGSSPMNKYGMLPDCLAGVSRLA